MADRGPYIHLFSGTRFYPQDPRPENIYISDIAHALSNICRFTGHVRDFLSVAQHCVMCAEQAPKAYKLEALLHDASEAYIADLSRPVKSLLDDYRKIEERIEIACATCFGLPYPMSPVVKEIDDRMLITEASQLFADDPNAWWKTAPGDPLQLFDIKIPSWSPRAAELRFLEAFNKLV